MNKAIIMMATYNGAMYLEKQLDSILSQTYQDWVLVVSDDHSDDTTRQILNRYKESDERMAEILIHRKTGGAYNNFFSLMYYVKKKYGDSFDYYFYCDQDDIWRPDKMETEIRILNENKGKAVLCFSDVEFIDGNGDKTGICASSVRKMEVGNQYDYLFEFRYLLGTSMAHDKELWKRIIVPPKSLCAELRHDQYIRKYAALFGRIIYIPDKLVLYRRHDRNVSGKLIDYDLISAIKKAVFKLPDILDHTASHLFAAEVFLSTIEDEKAIVSDYREAVKKNGIDAYRFLKKYNIEISDNRYEKMMYELLFVTGGYKLTRQYRKLKQTGKLF